MLTDSGYEVLLQGNFTVLMITHTAERFVTVHDEK